MEPIHLSFISYTLYSNANSHMIYRRKRLSKQLFYFCASQFMVAYESAQIDGCLSDYVCYHQ